MSKSGDPVVQTGPGPKELEFKGDALSVETTYECFSCDKQFTITTEYGDPIPEKVFHEECPEDPSWERQK